MLPGLLRPAPVTGGAVTGGAVIACQGKLKVSSAQQQCIRLARVSPRLTSGFKHVGTPLPPWALGLPESRVSCRLRVPAAGLGLLERPTWVLGLCAGGVC